MESEKLRDVIIDQAKYFLQNAGEFYPFGAMLSVAGSVVPIGVQMENDHPKPQEVIEILENTVIEKLKSRGEAKLAGIGTDVYYVPVGQTEKKSAIQIRILHTNGESVDYYLTYRKVAEKFIYEELITEKGTLNFLKMV